MLSDSRLPLPNDGQRPLVYFESIDGFLYESTDGWLVHSKLVSTIELTGLKNEPDIFNLL